MCRRNCCKSFFGLLFCRRLSATTVVITALSTACRFEMWLGLADHVNAANSKFFLKGGVPCHCLQSKYLKAAKKNAILFFLRPKDGISGSAFFFLAVHLLFLAFPADCCRARNKKNIIKNPKAKDLTCTAVYDSVSRNTDSMFSEKTGKHTGMRLLDAVI